MKETIGHYKVVAELGRGGMGVVYKGFDETLNRTVAIKVLSDQLATDDSVVERFKREAKSMAALNDPHIIQIYFIGEDGGTPYFVMEFVDGESLSDRLKREGSLPVAEARRILTAAARGLATAHARGVIHRDVKPGNLMLGPGGTVKIADFGIAMVQDFSKRLTNTGEFVGTPGYLSPEVCVGQPVDHRSDIFALGIVFYEMLTGDTPFTEVSPLGMMLEVVKAEIPDVRSVNKDVDDRTCAVLKNMIAKDPAQRYQSCQDLLADLASAGPVAATARPASAEFQSAATIALTQAESLSQEDLREAPTVVSKPGHAVVEPPPVRRSSRLPLALAALLVLGVAGGAGYLYRDRLFGASESAEGSVKLVQPAASEAPATPTPPAVAQTTDPAVTATSSDAGGSVGLPDLLASLGLGGEDGDSAAAADVPAEAAPPAEGNDLQATLAAAAEAASKLGQLAGAPSGGAESDQMTKAADQIGSALEQGAAALEAAAATLEGRPAEQAPVQVATAKPAPAVEPAPAGPARVVVVAVGDRAIAGPVEQRLEAALLDAEFPLLDEAFFPDIGRYAGSDYVDLAGLSALVRENGGDILVLAQVDYLGETPLQYYGEYSTLYSVSLTVRNILLAERRPLGRGWQSKVDFTTLNATEKARAAIDPILPEVTASLAEFKERE